MTDDTNSKIDALTAQVSALTGRLDNALAALGLQPGEAVKARHGSTPDRLTAGDVHAVTFATTRLATGYSIEQVDGFLDRVAEEIARLTEERDTALRERDALR